jgi:hypothetical protein
MALVQAGKQFTGADLKQTAGNTAAVLSDMVEAGLAFKSQLESMPDADLLADPINLTQEEINAIKGFYIGDLPGIASALQASAWIRQLLGTGV